MARRGAAAGRARSGASPRGAAAAPAPPRRRRARGRPGAQRRPRRQPCIRRARGRAGRARGTRRPWRRWRSPSTQVAFRGFVVIMIAPTSLLRRWQGRRRRSRGGPRRSRGCSAAGGLELAGFAGVFRSPYLPICGVTSKAEPRQFELISISFSARLGARIARRAHSCVSGCVPSDSRPLIRIDRRLRTRLLPSITKLASCKTLAGAESRLCWRPLLARNRLPEHSEQLTGPRSH